MATNLLWIIMLIMIVMISVPLTAAITEPNSSPSLNCFPHADCAEAIAAKLYKKNKGKPLF